MYLLYSLSNTHIIIIILYKWKPYNIYITTI